MFNFRNSAKPDAADHNIASPAAVTAAYMESAVKSSATPVMRSTAT